MSQTEKLCSPQNSAIFDYDNGRKKILNLEKLTHIITKLQRHLVILIHENMLWFFSIFYLHRICKITGNCISVSHRVPGTSLQHLSLWKYYTMFRISQRAFITPERGALSKALRVPTVWGNKWGTCIKTTDIKHYLIFTSPVVHGRSQVIYSFILSTIQKEM